MADYGYSSVSVGVDASIATGAGRCMNAPVKSLVDYLIDEGAVSRDQMLAAHEEAQKSGVPVGRLLVRDNIITEAQLVRALAMQVGLEFIDFTQYAPSREALAALPAQLARQHQVMPVRSTGRALVLAMADPGNVVALDEIRQQTGLLVEPAVATRDDVKSAISKYYRVDSELSKLTEQLEGNSLENQESDDVATGGAEDEENAPIVRYVNMMIQQAISDRASDIHVEPGEHEMRVRYRIDGVLHEVMDSPMSVAGGVISRLKVMASMDIAERRKPQDGRLSVVHEGQKIDLRVAALPTVWGEKIVMRILDNSTASMSLDTLGFSDDNYSRFETSFTKPYGMILVTGPTGSGKSTTLYATLNIVSRPEINVITVEDPVEYRIPGINQVQVNVKAGMTFAAALRSILRADPDVVLIGEIRDSETAQIAVEAALTGHLVLSTLHTNDSASAVTRLTEMGIEPFLVGSALDCVVAQRLARRLCPKCKEEYVPSVEELQGAGFPWSLDQAVPRLYRPAGCGECSNTGYKGRLALHEVMGVDSEIEKLAVERAASSAIARSAASSGMMSLREDGWIKVIQGMTSVEELLRVVA